MKKKMKEGTCWKAISQREKRKLKIFFFSSLPVLYVKCIYMNIVCGAREVLARMKAF